MGNRVMFDENSENGLIICEKYLPEELIAEIFCFINYRSLLNCQLVCKRWMIIIQNYVWRKKAEEAMGQSLHLDKDIPWGVYYMICKKKPFERNFIKNHSGELGYKKYWEILRDGGDHWTVENPPIGVDPIPLDGLFYKENIQSCFVSSYSNCCKIQIIDLEVEGLTTYVMDNLQPPIEINEWYSCRWDCPASYDCSVNLLGDNNKVIDAFNFHDVIEGERQGKWLHVIHEFREYGPGVRKISFCHKGKDSLFWAGHYGSKMAKASVLVRIPKNRQCVTEEPNGTSLLFNTE